MGPDIVYNRSYHGNKGVSYAILVFTYLGLSGGSDWLCGDAMIVGFRNSPRFFVESKDGLFVIIDSTTGLREFASNDEPYTRALCHRFNYPVEAQKIADQRARDRFADECARYGCD